MRFSMLIPAAAAAALAAAAAGQEAPEAPARGLSDLDETIGRLIEEETGPASPDPAAQAPAEDPPAEEPPAEEPAPAPPAPAADDGPTEPAPPLTRAETAAVERTAARGRLLIALARAGILATQDMLGRVSDPEGAGIAGWIAEPEGNAVTVTFYAEGEGGPQAVYRASILGGRVTARDVFLGAERPGLTPLQARMAAARAATDALDHRACTGQPFNVIVVPPATARAPIDVYQLSAPEAPGRFPLGGHFRATVAPDGSIAEARGFTNACVDLAAPPPPSGEAPAPLGLTHLLDPAPTEIHLFLAQLTGRPLLVATGEPHRVWLVTPERIAEVRP